jgi:hypothetical protein
MSNSLVDNVDALKRAEGVFELCGQETERFWECFKGLCETQLPKLPEPEDPLPAMDDREAQKFEKRRMSYGMHAGAEIGMIPPDYLLFLAEGDEFLKKLKRYIKSETFAERQNEN